MYWIGHLRAGGPDDPNPSQAAFRAELGTFGFVVGQNVKEYRVYAEGRLDRLPALAAELVQQKVDVMVALSTAAAQAAKAATSEIPIVMTWVTDPVTDGLISSLAQPGGNVTGTAEPLLERTAKPLEFLRKIFPNLRRMAMVIPPNTPNGYRVAKNLQAQAKIPVDAYAVIDDDDLQRQAETMKTRGTDAVWFYTASIPASSMGTFAVRHRLPTIVNTRTALDAGRFLFHGEDSLVIWRRNARYVAKILRGTKPRDLPVELSTHLQLVINLKTAKALGLTIPPSLREWGEVVE